MTFWENKPASKLKNEPITVKQNSSSASSGSTSTAPSWFTNSQASYANKYAKAPAAVAARSSNSGSTSSSSTVSSNPLGFNLTNPLVRNIDTISALMGGYNYDEGAIRALFDKATKAEYAAKRAADKTAQRQFATNTGSFINTLSDTMRQQLNQAVATGGSRGLAAAQAMQAAQDASLKTVDEATKLTEDTLALDYDEAAAYAENAKAAEELVASRKTGALNAAAALFGYDVQKYASDVSALGNYFYGGDAARVERKANKDALISNENIAMADRTSREAIADADRSAKEKEITLNILGGLVQSGNISPDLYDEVAAKLGLSAGSLISAPQNIYSNGGGSGTNDDLGAFNERNAREADARMHNGLLYGDFVKYESGAALRGVSYVDAKAEYERIRGDLYNKALELSYKDFKDYYEKTLGATTNAYNNWKYWRESAGYSTNIGRAGH